MEILFEHQHPFYRNRATLIYSHCLVPNVNSIITHFIRHHKNKFVMCVYTSVCVFLSVCVVLEVVGEVQGSAS